MDYSFASTVNSIQQLPMRAHLSPQTQVLVKHALVEVSKDLGTNQLCHARDQLSNFLHSIQQDEWQTFCEKNLHQQFKLLGGRGEQPVQINMYHLGYVRMANIELASKEADWTQKMNSYRNQLQANRKSTVQLRMQTAIREKERLLKDLDYQMKQKRNEKERIDEKLKSLNKEIEKGNNKVEELDKIYRKRNKQFDRSIIQTNKRRGRLIGEEEQSFEKFLKKVEEMKNRYVGEANGIIEEARQQRNRIIAQANQTAKITAERIIEFGKKDEAILIKDTELRAKRIKEDAEFQARKIIESARIESARNRR